MTEVAEAFDFGDNVDFPTFEQILEMDEGEEEDGAHEFSRSIVFGFLEQADSTFEKMEQAIKDKNLEELSSLGHFLKGSSATLGFTKVKDECEKIQHYGAKKDETGLIPEPDEKKCLQNIKISVANAKAAYSIVSSLMQRYYEALDG